MRINTNLTAMNTYGQYTKNNNKIASAVEKLSSGYAINSAADNAAGLAISEKMRAQIRGLEKSSSNAQDAISLIQTAEGALAESEEILQRMRELAVQSSSDTNEDGIDRAALQDEFAQLKEELNDISKNTTFNKKSLLDGSLATTKTTIGGQTSMATGNLSATAGNAASGLYNFSVSVVTTTAAVEAQAPDTLTVNKSTLSQANIASASGSVTNITDASSLYNGDYKISDVSYDSENGTFTLTATGGSDGSQVFKADVNMNALDLTSTNDITAKFSDGTNEFSVTFTLKTDAAVNNKDYTQAGNEIGAQELQLFGDSFVESGTSFSIDGGVDAVAEVKEVQANLTGASAVTLKAGDTSATFDNGVTVYFNELTTADIDTALIEDDITVTAGQTNTLAGTTANFAYVSVGTTSYFKEGDYQVTATLTNKLLAGTAADATTKTTILGSGTAQFTEGVSQTLNSTLSFNRDTNEYDLTVGSKTFSIAADDASLTAMGDGGTAATITFVADDGSDVDLSVFDVAAQSVGTSLQNAITSVGGTRHLTATTTATATGDGYLLEAESATDKYTCNWTSAPAATTAGSVNTYTFNDAEGKEAFTLTAVAGAGASAAIIAAGDIDDALSDITFTAADTEFDYSYQETFGTEASKIEVAKTSNAGLTFQVGANEGDEITININRMDDEYLGINGAKIGTQDDASAAIADVDKAINAVSSQRAYLGAIQNRLDHKIANLDTSAENLTSAESQIRDVDMAKEMTKFTNANILQQAATAMLAQANSLPQNVLSLIGG